MEKTNQMGPLTKNLDGSLNSTNSLTTSLKVPSLFTIHYKNGYEVHFGATSTPVALHAIKLEITLLINLTGGTIQLLSNFQSNEKHQSQLTNHLQLQTLNKISLP